MELPKVLIWRPEKENDVPLNDDDVGHVALKTDKYYVSIWPARYFKEDKRRRWFDLILFMSGVEGSLVLNINVDRDREGDCDPSVEYEIDVSVTNEDLNPIIEEFLLYNGINPENVTLKRGEELFLKRQEYEKLSPEQAEKVKEPQQPITSLLKTRYSFSAELLSGKDVAEPEAEPFYHKQQSCVSLVFNLIQTAWLKHHPDRPIEVPEFFEGLPANNYGEHFYRVMWFDSGFQQFFMSFSNNPRYTGQNTEEPEMFLAIQALKKSYFCLKIFLVFFPILVMFAYFFPFWGYPVFFGLCVFINYPFPMFHFVVGLFLMLLSYIYPVIPFISIVIFYVLYYITVFLVDFHDKSKKHKDINLLLEMCLNMGRNLVAIWAERLGW